MTKHWIAVASAAHVRIGRAQGFMQVCHGKGGPLRRISPGDHVAYYSPTENFGGKDPLQAFTAIGEVKPGAPYQADMGGGFRPFRRDVAWSDAAEVPIRPLLEASPSHATIRTGVTSFASACSKSRARTWK